METDREWDSGLEELLCSVLLFLFDKILATLIPPVDVNVFL